MILSFVAILAFVGEGGDSDMPKTGL
jgi:hypothetical protein